MSFSTSVTTAIGISDTIINREPGTANDINNAAQIGLAITTLSNPLKPVNFIVTVEASKLAFATGTTVLIQDINNNKPFKDIASDFAMITGNVVTGIGATAGLLSREIPGAGVFFKQMELLGVGLTLLGSGIKNYGAIVNGVPVAWEELKTEIGEKIESIKNVLSQDLVNVSAEVSAAWDSAKTSLLNTMDKVSNVINSVGTAAFDSSVQIASDALNSTKAAFDNLVSSSGIILQSITETVIGNTISVVVDATSEVVSYFSTNGTAISDTLSAAYWKFLDSIAKSLIDPLIIDLSNNGIALDSWQTSAALFDLNGNGTKENTGWTKANGDDAFLVIDKNSNGKIDDITEMFGNANIPGFTELAKYDSNKDNLINSLDSQFSLLRLWNDKNANGTVDTGEMTTLATNDNTPLFELSKVA